MEKVVNTVEENPDRENITKVWKDYTIEDAIIIIEKAVRAIKPETINSCWEKTVQMCMTSQDLVTEPINHEKDCGHGKQGKVWRVSRSGSWKNSRANKIPQQKGLTEDNLMEMSASEPVPKDEEEDVPENKLALGNLAEGFQLFTAFNFFYNIDPFCIMCALKLRQMVEEGTI